MISEQSGEAVVSSDASLRKNCVWDQERRRERERKKEATGKRRLLHKEALKGQNFWVMSQWVIHLSEHCEWPGMERMKFQLDGGCPPIARRFDCRDPHKWPHYAGGEGVRSRPDQGVIPSFEKSNHLISSPMSCQDVDRRVGSSRERGQLRDVAVDHGWNSHLLGFGKS